MCSNCSRVGSVPREDQSAANSNPPNYRDGKYVNELEAEEPPMLKAMGEWMRGGGDHTTPSEEVPQVKLTAADFKSPPPSGLRVTWLGHSTSLIEIDGTRLLTDPVWSERTSPLKGIGPKRFFPVPLPFEELPAVDAVLISHDHFDHLDRKTVERLAACGVRFIVPLGVGAHLEGWDIPRERIVELNWWESTRVGPLTVTATPGRHFSGRSLVMADRNETLWAGFAVRGPAHNVYYSGDTGMFDGFDDIGARLGPFDVAMIEVGAYNQLWADLHLGPEQAAQAAKQVRAALLIPVHWATFDLALHNWTEPAERLLADASGARVPLALPMPGEGVEPSSPPELTRWWPLLPWQTAEEHPIVSSKLAANNP